MNFIIYDPTSWEIVISGSNSNPTDMGLGTLMTGIDGSVNSWTYYVPNGYLTPYTASEAAAKAAVPSYAASWSNHTMSYVDQRSLADAQSAAMDALELAYANAIAQNVSFTTQAGVTETFQSDPDSINNLSASILGSQASQQTPPGFYWVAADNVRVPVTYADLLGLAAAIFAQASAAFAKLQNYKVQVRNANSPASVDAISWS